MILKVFVRMRGEIDANYKTKKNPSFKFSWGSLRKSQGASRNSIEGEKEHTFFFYHIPNYRIDQEK